MSSEIETSFTVGPPVHGKNFVDRRGVIKTAEKILSTETLGNVLLTGTRRIGKTSLCFKLMNTIESFRNTLSAYMSLEAAYGKSPERFTQGVLLHMIKAIASHVNKKTYSELLQDLAKPQQMNKDYRKLLGLFALVRQGGKESERSSEKKVGASFVAEAGLQEKTMDTLRISQLSAFEYLTLLEEVIKHFQKHQITKFILFIDEANKLALETNSRLIRENLNLFSAEGMQFCFVTTPEVMSTIKEAHDLFHHFIELGPFDDIGVVKSLIKNCVRIGGKAVSVRSVFADEAVDAIWKLAKGMPYQVQFLCKFSLEMALSSKRSRVELTDVLDVVATSPHIFQDLA